MTSGAGFGEREKVVDLFNIEHKHDNDVIDGQRDEKGDGSFCAASHRLAQRLKSFHNQEFLTNGWYHLVLSFLWSEKYVGCFQAKDSVGPMKSGGRTLLSTFERDPYAEDFSEGVGRFIMANTYQWQASKLLFTFFEGGGGCW